MLSQYTEEYPPVVEASPITKEVSCDHFRDTYYFPVHPDGSTLERVRSLLSRMRGRSWLDASEVDEILVGKCRIKPSIAARIKSMCFYAGLLRRRLRYFTSNDYSYRVSERGNFFLFVNSASNLYEAWKVAVVGSHYKPGGGHFLCELKKKNRSK